MDPRQFLVDRRREPHLQPGRERAHERARARISISRPRACASRPTPRPRWPARSTRSMRPPPAAAAAGPAPDVYLILGEAWWRDPDDKASPLDQLKQAGFAETSAVSPVYGGTTPNAEFEVLTGIPVKSFQAGIIPYQHYVQYITEASRSLPRLLSGKGYAATAYHNFTRRFWLRDQVYPKLGFARFVSMEEMTLVIQPNDWPTDEGLYQSVLEDRGRRQAAVPLHRHRRNPRSLCEGRRPMWRATTAFMTIAGASTMPRSRWPPSSSELDAQGQALCARAVRRSPAGAPPAPVEERHEVRDRPAAAPGAGADRQQHGGPVGASPTPSRAARSTACRRCCSTGSASPVG